MGGRVGQIKIKDHLSLAEAETGAELGNKCILVKILLNSLHFQFPLTKRVLKGRDYNTDIFVIFAL